MEAKELKPIQVQPQLLPVGDRFLSTHGFRSGLFLEHLESHVVAKPKHQWCDMSCATRTVNGGRSTLTGKKQMRQRTAGLFRYLLNKGKFLLIEYSGPRGQISAIKLLDPGFASQAEMDMAQMQLDRMKKRGDIQQHNYVRAQSIIGLK